jgi:SPP1 gp7 family putative phage head morphogenesis protein
MILKSSILHRPYSIERSYTRKLLTYNNANVKDVKDEVLPILKEMDQPSFSDDVERALNYIQGKCNQRGLALSLLLNNESLEIRDYVTRGIYRALRNFLNKGAKIEYAPNLAVDMFLNKGNEKLDEISRSWALTNSRLILSMPEKLIYDVSLVIQQGFREGQSMTSLINQIQSKANISRNRAKLIAADQIAKLNSNYVQYEQEQLGLPLYVWRTSDDERVRKPSHRNMNGKICTWLNPLVYKDDITDKIWKHRSSIDGTTYQVGQDIRCRCSAQIIVDTQNWSI